MAMFLRCLRYCLAGYNLARESALWWGRTTRQEEGGRRKVQRIGLGFVNTLSRYGYAWMEPRVDWTTLTFHNDVTDLMMFGNRMLKQAYTRHGGSVQDFFSMTKQRDTAMDYLRNLRTIPEARARVLEWLMHIILQQFRVDVLNSIIEDLADDCKDEETRKEIERGHKPFSYDYISSICRPERMVVMRVQRTTWNTPKKLLAYILGWKDGMERQYWENKPFRVMHRQCCAELHQLDPELGLHWDAMVRRGILRWHWLLPYPHKHGLTETNKVGERKWYSINVKRGREDIPVDELRMQDWQMMSQTYRAGHPEPVPEWMIWDRAQWEEWKEAWASVTVSRG